MISLPFAALGALAWSASEYAIHRFVGHGPKRAAPSGIFGRVSLRGLAYEFNREHLAHHTDPTYFAPTSRKLLAATVALTSVTGLLTPVLGLRRAGSFALGFAAAYGTYEVIHRRTHTHAPTGPYGRWTRRHHMAHHYRTPRANHGVTSPVWDHVWNTHIADETIRIPRRSAPAWLTAEDGTLRPEFAADYVLVGKEAAAAPDRTPASADRQGTAGAAA
jgi:hypothetical protein